MSRLPDLERFAKRHNLLLITIEDLIDFLKPARNAA
jgi:3,4-dihydroxy 2-butanone 4-phosphate synthase